MGKNLSKIFVDEMRAFHYKYSYQTGAEKIKIRTAQGWLNVPVKDIIWFEANVSCAKVHLTGKRSIESTDGIGIHEVEMNKHSFIRIHDSYLINPAHIKSYLKRKDEVVMTEDQVLPIAQRRKALFLEKTESP